MNEQFFHIEVLPATYGDCLWIEYGTRETRGRILIDGGPIETYRAIMARLKKVPSNARSFELIVLTHVDADHIEGLVKLFADNPLTFAVDHVWFNGWRQMKKQHGLLGPAQGEFLSALLTRRVPRAWNASRGALVVPERGKLPFYRLPGGMQLTLLSPSPKGLAKMARAWSKSIARNKEGIRPGDLDAAWAALGKRKKLIPKRGLLGASPRLDALLAEQFVKDDAAPNGSSIAFLAEYAGKSCLFLADSHPQVISENLQRLCQERGVDKLSVDAVKVSHHGSKHNTSEALLSLVTSPTYIISTNGDKFRHPDAECIARIVKFGCPRRVCFNYDSDFTKPWLTKTAQKAHGYTAMCRSANKKTLVVKL